MTSGGTSWIGWEAQVARSGTSVAASGIASRMSGSNVRNISHPRTPAGRTGRYCFSGASAVALGYGSLHADRRGWRSRMPSVFFSLHSERRRPAGEAITKEIQEQHFAYDSRHGRDNDARL